MATFRLDLDLDKSPRIGARVRVRQGDKESCVVEASVFDAGAQADLSGRSARFCCLKPDRTMVRDASCSISDNVITHTLDQQVSAVAGLIQLAYFEVLDASGAVVDSTQAFSIEVEEGAEAGSSGVSQSYYSELDALVGQYEQAIQQSQSDYEAAEASRQSAFDSAQQQRATDFSSAQSSRDAAFQQAQTQRQTDYEQAEAARDAAQDANDERQDANDAAQTANDSAQAKNNADQQLNNQMAQGLQVVILSSGQYDPGTLEPTVSGEAGKLYFVPAGSGDDEDAYVEWMWVGSAWERVGMSNATIEAITTDQIDSVLADGSPQGEQVLNLTGLSYLWAKLKAWATGAFAALSHKHAAADVTSGTLPLSRGGTGTASLARDAGNGGFVAASAGNATLFAETGTGAAYSDMNGTHVGTLPVSLGGTGATSASAALTSLGAASASDLQSVRDSLSQKLEYFTAGGNDVVDLDEVVATGVYSYNDPLNRPDGTGGWVNLLVVQMNYSSTYVTQLAMCNTSVHYRTRLGSWGAWRAL